MLDRSTPTLSVSAFAFALTFPYFNDFMHSRLKSSRSGAPTTIYVAPIDQALEKIARKLMNMMNVILSALV